MLSFSCSVVLAHEAEGCDGRLLSIAYCNVLYFLRSETLLTDLLFVTRIQP